MGIANLAVFLESGSGRIERTPPAGTDIRARVYAKDGDAYRVLNVEANDHPAYNHTDAFVTIEESSPVRGVSVPRPILRITGLHSSNKESPVPAGVFFIYRTRDEKGGARRTEVPLADLLEYLSTADAEEISTVARMLRTRRAEAERGPAATGDDDAPALTDDVTEQLKPEAIAALLMLAEPDDATSGGAR
mgnify:CR=1 FL=1